MANRNVSSTFTGTGNSTELVLEDIETLSLSGFGSATILLQYLLDGTNWRTVGTYTADTELGVIGLGRRWRVRCSVYGSGTITYFLGSPA